ncbi:Probable galactinol--sucrose galactosyltransferase 6 [Linum grandiflorum]
MASLSISPYCNKSTLINTVPNPNPISIRSSIARSIHLSSLSISCNLVKKRNKPKPKSKSKSKSNPMTITPAIRITDQKLTVNNRTILAGVPDNVVTTYSGPAEGVFLGAILNNPLSRHVVPLGTLRGVRFMSCFRFKLWWMAQRMGDRGKDIPLETQFLLLETKTDRLESDGGEDEIMYTVMLPLIDGAFRASLQGNENDELELCLESGDSDTKAASFTHAMFVHAGTDPFATITEAMLAVRSHLKTFRLRHEKKLPGILDYFGWCTWDAFYQEVTQDGVEAGLRSLARGGTPPKFVIIDDGWQSVGADPAAEKVSDHSGSAVESQPLMRLTGIKENSKFRNKEVSSGTEAVAEGIKSIVNIAKQRYGLKYVYVWHAITGYWGGVRPGEYESAMKYPMVSKGVAENEPGWKTDVLAVQGLGLVNPKNVHKFYNELHSYLAGAGVDGVKVDVQCILETLGGGFGGRVELTKQYHQALDSSVASNFPDNGCIACMSHNTDALYCSKQTAVVRASDDFYPRDPVSHTIHIASVAYNSVFLGEIMQPDWDMFHSMHPAAEYHASARAISGGPLYVSDAPGKHNFELLKKLVLPDGTILRALLPGRPTRDCLFSDPARDGVSLLKIWNMNKYTGVIGVYNCQGAAWNATERKNTFHQTRNDTALTGTIRCRDVDRIREASLDSSNWDGSCAVYCHNSGELTTLQYNAVLPVSLKVLEFEIYTVTPIKVLRGGVSFAPLGLIEMFNGGAAIQGVEYGTGGKVWMEVKGCGKVGVYSSVRPKRCVVDSCPVEFEYDRVTGLVSFVLEKLGEEGKFHEVEVEM